MKLHIIPAALLLLLIGANSVCAQQMQWKAVAPFALQPARLTVSSPAEYGAIAAKGKIVLAGWKNLLLSADGGATWTNLSNPMKINDVVMDISIYDDNTYAFISLASGAFLSLDKGMSWQNIVTDGGGTSIVFDGSPTRLAMIIDQNIADIITVNVSQKRIPLQIDYASSLRVAADGTLRIFGAIGESSGWLYTSLDHGNSWSRTSMLDHSDAYSFIADQSDPKKYVVVNENWISRSGGYSNLYLTNDNGISWNSTYNSLLGGYADLCGASATGCHDYFAGKATGGVLRSSDKGLNWQQIGGPPLPVDSRSLAAADDSLIFALDTNGTIWSTVVSKTGLSASTILGYTFFSTLSMTPCDAPVTGTIVFTNPTCLKIDVSYVQIIGNNSSEYTVIGSLSQPFAYPDSIRIRFSPSGTGKKDAKLKVTYSDGSTITVDIGVNVQPSPVTIFPAFPFQKDTLSMCESDSLSLIISTPCSLFLPSIKFTGTDTSSFFVGGKQTAQLPADSVVKLYCIPKHTGDLDVYLYFRSTDGRAWYVTIHVFVKPDSLEISPKELFLNDTIGLCGSDTSLLRLTGQCHLNFPSLSIIGPDSTSFSLNGKNTGTYPQDSVIKVICNPQHPGNLSAKIHIISADGRSWDVPLNTFAQNSAFSFHPQNLFANDTIVSCSSDSASLIFSTPCTLDISSISFTGVDAPSFALSGKSFRTLPADSVITVVCNPLHFGMLDATLHITASDGRIWDIPMAPVVSLAPLIVQPSPFASDTIASCVNDSGLIRLTSLCSLDLASLAITGTDAASFMLSGKTAASLPADSLIKIFCIPQHIGSLDAVLHITAADGRNWDIPVHRFASEAPLIFKPLGPFALDSFEFCSATTDSLQIGAVCPLTITSVSLTGTDAASFVYSGKSNYSLPLDSMMYVECIPQHSGKLDAFIHVITSGGAVWDIPLSPFIKPNPTVSFVQSKIADTFTDTVGGDVEIPITFSHTGYTSTAEFTLHYDTLALVYRGVFDKTKTDLTIGHPDSRSARISFNTVDSVLYARFNFYPVDSVCTHITIDSLTGAGGNSGCLSILSGLAGANICSPAECGHSTLARFIRSGKMPQLFVSPNPGSGNFTVTTSEPLGVVTISVTDKLGVTRLVENSKLSPDNNAKLHLESLPSGLYFIRVSGLTTTLPVVLEK